MISNSYVLISITNVALQKNILMSIIFVLFEKNEMARLPKNHDCRCENLENPTRREFSKAISRGARGSSSSVAEVRGDTLHGCCYV